MTALDRFQTGGEAAIGVGVIVVGVSIAYSGATSDAAPADVALTLGLAVAAVGFGTAFALEAVKQGEDSESVDETGATATDGGQTAGADA